MWNSLTDFSYICKISVVVVYIIFIVLCIVIENYIDHTYVLLPTIDPGFFLLCCLFFFLLLCSCSCFCCIADIACNLMNLTFIDLGLSMNNGAVVVGCCFLFVCFLFLFFVQPTTFIANAHWKRCCCCCWFAFFGLISERARKKYPCLMQFRIEDNVTFTTNDHITNSVSFNVAVQQKANAIFFFNISC